MPHLAVPRRADYAALFRIGFYVFLMQLSVVLADKVDTTILGYALPDADPGPSITVYQNVSKPFFQIRQTSWTLAYLVVPAVASLAASRDAHGPRSVKYDGTRFLVGLLLPVALLAGIYAGPFLNLWVGPRYAPSCPVAPVVPGGGAADGARGPGADGHRPGQSRGGGAIAARSVRWSTCRSAIS